MECYFDIEIENPRLVTGLDASSGSGKTVYTHSWR